MSVDLGKRRHVGAQLGQPAEDMGIAAQLFQPADLGMVGAQVTQETAGRYRDNPAPRIRRVPLSEIPPHVGTAAPKDVREEFVSSHG